MKKEIKPCCICGKKLKHELLMEARKGIYYNFCSFHFQEYIHKPMKEVREQIKFNKKLLKWVPLLNKQKSI